MFFRICLLLLVLYTSYSRSRSDSPNQFSQMPISNFLNIIIINYKKDKPYQFTTFVSLNIFYLVIHILQPASQLYHFVEDFEQQNKLQLTMINDERVVVRAAVKIIKQLFKQIYALFINHSCYICRPDCDVLNMKTILLLLVLVVNTNFSAICLFI